MFALADEAHAYRPFDGTDADVSQFGEVELELGPVGYLRAGHTSYVVAPGFVGNFGFLPRWELVVEAQDLIGTATGSTRVVDTGCFLKHVLREGTLQGKTGLSIAMEVGALLPTINDVPGAGVYLAFIASHVWPELTVHLNLELARARDGLGDALIGGIFEGTARRRIRPVAELYVESHAGVTTPSALVGFIWRANEHFAFDAATRLARTGDAPTFELRAGLTWTFTAWR